ncbi:MAG: hypothetical protein ACOYO1_06845 [Bacteroidales bacterium]
MKIFAFIPVVLFVFMTNVNAQELTIEGIYNGKNLYVLNPDAGSGFCVNAVKVNGKKTADELNSNSFEIDFSQINIEKGTKVNVQIYHQDNCMPKIINPEILRGSLEIGFLNAKVNRKGFLGWDILGNLGEGEFTIEQFRWQKWINLGVLKSNDTIAFNKFNFEVSPNTAQNLFRIKYTDSQGQTEVSKDIKYILPGKEITIVSEKIKDRIAFSSITMYEIIDESGNLVLKGNDKYIDTSSISKGKYFINYDNKSEAYTKK